MVAFFAYLIAEKDILGWVGTTSELIDIFLFLVCLGSSSCRIVSSVVFLLADRLGGVPLLLFFPSSIDSLDDATYIDRARDLVNRLGITANWNGYSIVFYAIKPVW